MLARLLASASVASYLHFCFSAREARPLSRESTKTTRMRCWSVCAYLVGAPLASFSHHLLPSRDEQVGSPRRPALPAIDALGAMWPASAFLAATLRSQLAAAVSQRVHPLTLLQRVFGTVELLSTERRITRNT